MPMRELPLAVHRRPDTTTLLPLHLYDLVLVQFSGGKDSVACLLHLLDLGVPPGRLQAWHQHVDGGDDETGLMDWPCSLGYCRALTAALGVRLLVQYREGGFEREMLRHNSPTAPVRFERQNGSVARAGGVRGKPGTRLRFPQTSADLRVRWCSPYLKIDVCSVAINNDPALGDKRVLVVTGERRQESAARARYAEQERHRSTNSRRRVDHWRPVLDWSEAEVWERLRARGVVPHPAYCLGWGRVSCLSCVFGGADQWASVRALAPGRFERVARYEERFGVTIKQGSSIRALADRGTPYPEIADPTLRAASLSARYAGSVLVPVSEWALPAGAFRSCGGPS